MEKLESTTVAWQAERAAWQAERAELIRQRDQLDSFCQRLAHDFKGAVHNIAMLAEMLAADLPADSSEEFRFGFDLLQRASYVVSHTVSNLRAYVSIDRRPLRRGRVPLRRVVADVLDEMISQQPDCAEFIVTAPDATLLTDHDDLRAVLLQLLDNAYKFRGEATPRAMIRVDRDSTGLCLEVADNGIGIEPQYRERVLEPFERLHSRDEYPGAGLGLAICQRVALRHGGRLELATSELGGLAARLWLTSPDTSAHGSTTP